MGLFRCIQLSFPKQTEEEKKEIKETQERYKDFDRHYQLTRTGYARVDDDYNPGGGVRGPDPG